MIALIDDRVLSPRAMRIIGEATGLHLVETCGASPLVVVGWDRRPDNPSLVDSLTSGLSVAGCRTLCIGEVPTPGLHHALLSSAADAGMMVTASHNPASDSGVKLFDANGFKSMPEAEDRISSRAWDLVDGSLPAPQGRGESLEEIDGLRLYRSGLKARLGQFEALFDTHFASTDWSGLIPPQGLLVDASGGAATDWLADGLSRRGLESIEVSSRLDPINENCGAGGLSPTAAWTLSELLMETQSHRLLWTLAQRLEMNDGMAPWSTGQIVGAALDGDGDRCLLLAATETGVAVVDGDRMCDAMLRAAVHRGYWQLAASIESDLGLTADLCRLGEHTSMVTAVGDRWLSAALMPAGPIEAEVTPLRIGTEDSGHIVLPVRMPETEHWTMVGDGAASLLASLLAFASLEGDVASAPFTAGWKRRVSISPSDRSRWTGRNDLAEAVQREAEHWAGGPLERIDVEGEPALLLLQTEGISVAVRNSGTQAKTAISVRLAAGVEADGQALVEALRTLLEPALTP